MNVEIVGDGPVTLVIDSIKDPKAVKKQEKLKERAARQAKPKQEGAAASKEEEGAASRKEEEEEKE